MSSPLYLDRGHAVVGGHLFSPIPPKRHLDDSLMQESRILPSDREARLGSPLIHKAKDVEVALTSSFVETDSAISSCMLTSESFYLPNESLSTTSVDGDCVPFEQFGKASGDCGVSKTPINDEPAPRIRKRNVNWGDRSSIRLSIEYPKSLDAVDKTDKSNYFKICFGTEFSDEDDTDRSSVGSDTQSMENVYAPKSTAAPDCGLVTSSDLVTNSITKMTKKLLVKVDILSSATSKLLGVIETEDGMLSQKTLENFSIPQLQIIVNDLFNQISQKNVELMTELPRRDDLNQELEAKKNYLHSHNAQSRASGRIYKSPRHRMEMESSSAFNPFPEYRFPFNSPPPRISLDRCDSARQESTHKVPCSSPVHTPMGARLKTYFNRFFASRRPRQLVPQDRDDANFKSLSF